LQEKKQNKILGAKSYLDMKSHSADC